VNPVDALVLGAAIVSVLSYAFGVYTARCSADSPCPKCSYHVNEKRVRGLEAERLRVEAAERQQVLRHDAEHKGWGWATGAPDQYNCPDKACPRNVKGRGENTIG